jgi:hypothetical protein
MTFEEFLTLFEPDGGWYDYATARREYRRWRQAERKEE